MLMVMECIHFVVPLVNFFREVVACGHRNMVLLEEIMLLENLVHHEGKTGFLKYLAEHEYIKGNLIDIEVVKRLLKLL